MNTICRVNSLGIHSNTSTVVAATDLTQLFTSKRSISNVITNKNTYTTKNNKNTKSISNNSNRSLKTTASNHKKNLILARSNNLFSNFVKSSLPINSILGNLQLNKCEYIY